MPKRRLTLGAVIVGGLIVGVAGRSFRRLAIAEHSMEPALSSGDFVVAKTARWPHRGDIVTFRHPLREDMLLVKRVVGLPGERLTVANGQVHIDGRVLAEHWADGPTRPDAEWQIGADEVVVLSDNRAATVADSRMFGPLPISALEHRAVFRYWPNASAGPVR